MLNTSYGFLRANGLVNELYSYNELASGKKRNIIAYCTSEECCGNYKSKVRKEVDTQIDNCPDCGYALLWGTEHEIGRGLYKRRCRTS